VADLDLLIDLSFIPDEATRNAVVALLNLVERLYAEYLALRLEVQQLKDEIARLKGEQGKPSFPAPRPPKPAAPPRTKPPAAGRPAGGIAVRVRKTALFFLRTELSSARPWDLRPI
jgi:hypothetical protein